MSSPMISDQYLEGFVELAEELGGQAESLYAEAGLPFGQGADHNPTDIHLQDFGRHVKLLDLAINRLSSPSFCLELATRQSIGAFGAIGIVASYCSTVKEAIEFIIKHLQFAVDNVHIELQYKPRSAMLLIHCDYEQVAKSRGYQDHALALIYQLLSMLLGDKIIIRAAYLSHSENRESAMYSRYFNCPVAFEHEFLGLAFDPGQLEQPVDESAKTLPVRVLNYLRKRHNFSLVEQVKHIIKLTLVSDACNLVGVARTLGFSKRTLQRRLQEQEVSFQQLVDDVRDQTALTYLAQAHFRLIDIAAVLGYSELSAFSRSFKRRWGISPQQWRQQNKQANKRQAKQ